MQLRNYQKSAVEAAIKFFRNHQSPACIVLPTGAGKSLVIADEKKGGKVRLGYKNCLLRGNLVDGQISHVVDVPSYINEIAMEARPYDGSEPIVGLWQRGQGDALLAN